MIRRPNKLNSLNKKAKGVKKIISCICALLFVIALFGTAVFADDYEIDKNGNISITLQQTDKDGNAAYFKDITITLYKIGSVRYDTGAVFFDFDSSFSSVGIDISDTKTASEWIDAAKTLSDMVSSQKISGDTKVSDESGKINYTDLAQGIYLLVQTKADETVTISPILLTVPFMEDGTWVYDIASYPKLSTKPKTTVTPTPTVTVTPGKPVNTGDNSMIVLWSEIFIGAVAAILITVYVFRRKLNN